MVIMNMRWYYKFLVHHPYIMILVVSVLCSLCIIVSLTLKSLPDFSDPTLGFETRGTTIGNHLTAWYNLLQQNEQTTLVSNPNDVIDYQRYWHSAKVTGAARRDHLNVNRKRKGKHKKQRSKKLRKGNHSKKKFSMIDNQWSNMTRGVSSMNLIQINNDDHMTGKIQFNESHEGGDFSHGYNKLDADSKEEKKVYDKNNTVQLTNRVKPSTASFLIANDYFCKLPAKEFSHFVIERIGPNATDTLFDVNSLLAMCQLQEQIISVANYDGYCQKQLDGDACCRPWSLSNYVALLSNKSSCFDINDIDIIAVQNLLLRCYEYFYILNDCTELTRCPAPSECIRHSAVFSILYYLTDMNFIGVNSSSVFLKYAMIFVPVAHSSKILPLFYEWEKMDLKNELVQVVAMDLGLENDVFNDCLLRDSWLVTLGGIFVMTCMWLYTTSLFVTAMTCLAISFSLGLAYFIYTVVFAMTFFPYMNLLAVVVIIGTGADDAFIFVKIWQCVRLEYLKSILRSSPTSPSMETKRMDALQEIMASTLRHAAISMFVTSLTTAGAFFVSYISSITSIKCFGVFAGTAVMANYLLMVTWLPASISIMERITVYDLFGQRNLHMLLSKLKNIIGKFCNACEHIVVAIVIDYSTLWMTLFGLVGLGSAIIVLYYPGLQLPESSHFQLFVSSHPFEVYEAKVKNTFWFERSLTLPGNFKMPLRFIWGILPIDDGDYSNPFSRGRLHFDANFNISTQMAQRWLLELCQNIRQQRFYQTPISLLPNLFMSNCFIEDFIGFMNRSCIESMDGTDRTPCCDISTFPFVTHVFDRCLPEFMAALYATPREYFWPGNAGPRFQISQPWQQQLFSTTAGNHSMAIAWPPSVGALVIEFESNIAFSTSYNEMQTFVSSVEDWLDSALKTAPLEMQGAWFTSELKFFDVQDTLSKGTMIAVAVAMVACLIVLLCVTLNVLISLFAILTVSFIILTTVAILILLDWKLNILESVAVNTAIGLAVDFSLHYGIHYRLSPSSEREKAARFALARIFEPTAMAALTTAFAGLVMLASSILPYVQIGIFLIIVMTTSWLFSTFFLMSLLKLFGPEHGFMQFQLKNAHKQSSPRPTIAANFERCKNDLTANGNLLPSLTDAHNGTTESHELNSLKTKLETNSNC